MVNCPTCHVALEAKQSKERTTEVDRCPQCGGVWFDDGEVAQVIGAAATTRVTVPPSATPKANMLCPRCQKPLALFTYPGTMTLVEGCKSCNGIWLDAGEIQEIAKARRERKMTCPACSHEQPAAEACAKCGIIIKKFGAPPRARPVAISKPRGVKETLIEFIDGNLQSMWDGIRG